MTASVMMIILMRVTADSSRMMRLPLVRDGHFIGAFGGVSTFESVRPGLARIVGFKRAIRRAEAKKFKVVKFKVQRKSLLLTLNLELSDFELYDRHSFRYAVRYF